MTAQEYLERGVDAFNNDDFDKAIEDFTKAKDLDPNLADAKMNLSAAYFNRGVSRFQKGKEGAIPDLDEAIKLNPNDAMSYGARGVMYAKEKNYEKIIENFTRVIDLEPTASAYIFRQGGYYDKCKAYRAAGDKDNFFKYIDLAINDVNAALQLDPDNALTQDMLGNLTREREARVKIYEGLSEIGREIKRIKGEE